MTRKKTAVNQTSKRLPGEKYVSSAERIGRGYNRSILSSLAGEELKSLLPKPGSKFGGLGLADFVPKLSPVLERPDHLLPFVSVLERAVGGNLRSCFAAPPQHGKTLVTSHAFPYWALQPDSKGKRFGYATYSQERTEYVSRKVQGLCLEAGLTVSGNLSQWEANGCEFLFTSVEGKLTGYGFDGCLVIDDPTKDRKDVESALRRERQREWFDDVAEGRVHPGGSIIAMATRWHPADLSGYLISEVGFQYINLQAICEDSHTDPLGRQVGEALWPSKRPLDFLLPLQRNAFTWASLYQGRPRPRDGSLFQDATYYDALPSSGFRVSYGIDFAYSATTSSDYSVLVTLFYEPKSKTAYVVDVTRLQIDAPRFIGVARSKYLQRPAPIWWYASNTEKAVADFARREGLSITVKPVKADKYVRAQATSSAWNQGRILLPAATEANPWVADFLEEITSFTGINDPHDDQVDALVAAFDAVDQSNGDMTLLRVPSRSSLRTPKHNIFNF